MESLSDVLARRVRELRADRGLTAEQLAARVRALGGDLGRVAITKIERPHDDGRRRVTIEELVLLAGALNTSPIELLTPQDPPSERVRVTDSLETTGSDLRAWARGEGPTTWDVGRWEDDATRRAHEYHRAKPAKEYAVWQARHPAVRAAQDLLRQCEDLAAREVDEFLYEIEPVYGYQMLVGALQTARRHLVPVLDRLERAYREQQRREGHAPRELHRHSWLAGDLPPADQEG